MWQLRSPAGLLRRKPQDCSVLLCSTAPESESTSTAYRSRRRTRWRQQRRSKVQSVVNQSHGAEPSPGSSAHWPPEAADAANRGDTAKASELRRSQWLARSLLRLYRDPVAVAAAFAEAAVSAATEAHAAGTTAPLALYGLAIKGPGYGCESTAHDNQEQLKQRRATVQQTPTQTRTPTSLLSTTSTSCASQRAKHNRHRQTTTPYAYVFMITVGDHVHHDASYVRRGL